MGVLVCFHAHPDDEVFTTGGTMRLAADAGHRVVLVTATDGALGEVPDALLAPGESLAGRREREVRASAAALGAVRVELLGYADSGMAGTPDNDNPAAFSRIDADVAAGRLAAILADERADVLTIYDDHGNYGHPDHVAVHRVGLLAAARAGVPHVYEATTNREALQQLMAARDAAARTAGTDPAGAAPAGTDPAGTDGAVDAARSGADDWTPDWSRFGLPAAEITTTVDVTAVLGAKRAAMVAHASQIGDFGPMLAMDPETLALAMGREWFRRHGAPAGFSETRLPLD